MIEFILTMSIIIAEIFGAMIIGLLIQFIFYKVFKINIYKLLTKSLNNLDKYLTAKLG